MLSAQNLSRSSTVFDQQQTLIAVIELSRSSWLVAGVLPGIERQPLKKLEPDESALLGLLHQWRDEAIRQGASMDRIVVTFETGRDGFWLARWLRQRGIEVHVMHAASVAVSREHRRAKTDRLDTEMLKRAFLGWLRGEREHCKMVVVPTLAEEDAKRPSREREALVEEHTWITNRLTSTLARLGIRGFNPKLKSAATRLPDLRTPEGELIPPHTLAARQRDLQRRQVLRSQIAEIEVARRQRLQERPGERPHAMLLIIAKVVGVGVETADMLVQEVLMRPIRDRRALARFAGLTGSPNESGATRRSKGLARSGNARVRRGMVQLAWRFLKFQPDSDLAQWYRRRTEAGRGLRKPMIVALARKLLIALWRLATAGEVPKGVVLHTAMPA